MSLEAAENAIRAWVRAGSGLADGAVFFSNQKVDRPAGPYVTVHVESPTPVGACDAVVTEYSAARAAGEEIELRVEGERRLSVSIQVWKGATTGAGTALALAHRIQLAARLPSVNAALNAAGLGVADIGAARDLSALLGTDFEGRASFDAEFNYRETLSEFTTYIETAVVIDRESEEEFTLVQS